MAELSRAEKKALRELAGAAYEAEARLALDELDAHFQRWREGETLGSELIAAIHEFHQQVSVASRPILPTALALSNIG